MMTTVLMRLVTVVRCITVTQGSRRSSRKGVSLEFDLHERAPLLEVPARLSLPLCPCPFHIPVDSLSLSLSR